ncbi:MAG: VirB8/TrbF family protein [Acidobacteriota bacterium]|nr:VirB8/TrbF family protein [Acidobacteriota bacterium]
MTRRKKPDPGKEFAEIWGEQVASNRFLRLWVFTLAGIVLLLLVAVVRLSAVELPKPIVIRVDEIGRAQALDYEAVEAQADPLDPTTKYFLNQWLSDFYSRRRATVETSWARSLNFLDSELANAAFRTESAAIAEMAAGITDDERQVEGVVLRINSNPEPPHAATADFDLVTLQRGQPTERERWTASLQFTFLDQVPPDLLPSNPMGLVITFLQADRAAAFE